MAVRKANSNPGSSSPVNARLSVIFVYIIISLFILLFPFVQTSAQKAPEYDEISIFMDIPLIGGSEINAVIKGQELFLPVTDLFDFLKIRNTPSPGLESVSGFFISQEATYVISQKQNQIRYQDMIYNLEPGDLIRTESNLFLKASYFGKVFGIECIFNFRSLSVTIKSKLELPLIREMRQEEMRKNLTRLKGNVIADTTIGLSHPLFKFGMADWSVIASEEVNGRSSTSLNLDLGSIIAGGETNANIYYNSSGPFSEKQQYYQWRYVNNDFKAVRQVMVGKIATNAIASIYDPVVGIQITNTPTTYRRSFGSYTLSDKTEPGWIVELYVNNVLVDYVKADASGFFTFQVPLVYGNSVVKLKFYGPWGEERTREQNISIPFNFLPKNTMEYTVSGGFVEDSLGSRYSRANINYGVSRSITLGGGMEYLSSIKSNPAMPYINTSLRVTNNLLINGEYTYGVRAKGTLTYRMPSNLQLDLYYTWYDKNQKAINYNYCEERKAVLSIPLILGKFSSYQRVSVYQVVLPSSKYTTGEWLFSGSIFGVNTNLTTSALFVDQNKPYIYSNLSLAVRLPANFILMPQAQYSYTQNRIISAKLAAEKHLLKHAYLNLSYENIFSSNIKMAELGFRYDFSFAQTGASVSQSDQKTTFIQYASGSIINDRKTRYLGTDNRNNVGKGGITIVPFLDLNANGKRDPGEPKAYGLNLHINGGRVEKSDRDTTIRILNLEPYTTYFIELDPNSFGNVSWKLQKPTLNVAVDPNILKLIEIPVSVVGEATGKVVLDKDGEKKGLGRIVISFFKTNLKPAGKTISEDDGYFSYLGLAPGNYTVRIDSGQLKKLRMTSEPDSLTFNIKAGIDGDIVDGLNFLLKMKHIDTTTNVTQSPKKSVVKKDTTFMIVHEVTQELETITEDSYAIQLGAFRNKSNAEAMRRKLQKLFTEKVDIIVEDNFYKVRINDIKERKEVDADIAILQKNGVNELWVISLKAKKQQWVIREKQHTVTKITENVTENPVIASTPEMLIEAFRILSNTIALRQVDTTSLDKKLNVVNDEGFYKVSVAGVPKLDETVLQVMKKHEPYIGKMEFKNKWSMPVVKLPVEEPAVTRPEVRYRKLSIGE